MTSRHLLDPQLEPMLDLMPAFEFTRENLPKVRQIRYQAVKETALPIPEGVVVEDVFVPGLNGAPDVRIQISRPEKITGKHPAILHLHGGGYIMGSPEMMAPQCAVWAERMGAIVCSVDYRLAPETIAPGNVEDGYAALKWMHVHAESLSVDTDRIAVAGESAGGGLAAALALMVRDRGEYKFCYQHLIFPMVDDRSAVRTDMADMHGEFVWTQKSNFFGWSALLGQAPGLETVPPYSVPARAETLSGLPPAFIATGGLDLFVDENLEYAKRLMAEGVPVELHVYPGAPHAFMRIVDADVTRRYGRDAGLAMKRGLGVD